jgi:hypothetical protein
LQTFSTGKLALGKYFFEAAPVGEGKNEFKSLKNNGKLGVIGNR